MQMASFLVSRLLRHSSRSSLASFRNNAAAPSIPSGSLSLSLSLVFLSTLRSLCTGLWRRQWMSSHTSNKQPHISDADVNKAFNRLLAVNWLEIQDETEDLVEAALSKASDDRAGQETLKNAWRAAEAVEKFSGGLVSLRMELDELNGFSGENVKEVPEDIKNALEAALRRYNNYLAAFKEDEAYLKKKVETELGSQFIHIRQRCSNLGPEWGNITLLGTSGLSGSYIERRGA